MAERAQHAAPEAAAQSPDAEVATQHGNIVALGAHAHDMLHSLCAVDIDSPPFGGRPQIVDVQMVLGEQCYFLTGLVKRDILVVAQVIKSLGDVFLDVLAELRGGGRYALQQQLDVED